MYSIQEQVGEGFGKVFKAIDKYGEMVAIKRSRKLGNVSSREVEMLQKTNHPHVIKLIDFFYSTENGRIWLNIILPYYPYSLAGILREAKSLSKVQIKKLILQICEGLDYLHSKLIVHRDLTPSNILVSFQDGNWNAIVSDLGSSKMLGTGINISYVTARDYRAPELFFGGEYGTSVDSWSLGCIVFEIHFEKKLFHAKDDVEHLIRVFGLLGTPTENDFRNLSFIVKKSLKAIPKMQPIELKSIIPSDDWEIVSFIERLIVWSPLKRATMKECLEANYYFQD